MKTGAGKGNIVPAPVLLCTVTASCQQAGKSLCANDNKLTKEDRTWSDMKWIDHLPYKAGLPHVAFLWS